MGGSTSNEIVDLSNSNLGMVQGILSTLVETFKTLEQPIKDDLLPYISILETSFNAVENAGNIKDNFIFKAPYYKQAESSLFRIKALIEEYVKNQDPKLITKISLETGHFADRVGQRILEEFGKKEINQYMAEILRQYKTMQNLLQTLEGTGKVLLEYVRRNTISALWTEFERQKRYARFKSWLWGCFSVVSITILSVILFSDIEFSPLEQLHVSEKTPIGFIIIALLPRTFLKVIIAGIAFICWRMFNNYKHLETSFLQKENASKLLPLLTKEMSNSQSKEILYSEFLKQVMQSEQNGFMTFAKEKSLVDIQNISKAEEKK